MPYAVYDDIEKHMGKAALRDIADDESVGVPVRVVVESAIADASGLLDGFFAQIPGLTVPISNPTTAHRWATCAIAGNMIRMARDTSTEDSRRASEQAIKWAEGVVKSALKALELADDGEGTGPIPGDDPALYEPLFASSERVFTRKTTGGVF